MNITVIIQARTGSTRLPRKVLKIIKGKTILQHVIERVKTCKKITDIIIATTIKQEDDIIVEEAKKSNVKSYRGSQEDVLSRYYHAAQENKTDIIIRITSDCPVIDPKIIDYMIEKFLEIKKTGNIDYISNKIKMTYPRGLDVEVFSFKALEKSFLEAKLPYEREHVTPYIYLNPDKFKILNYENAVDYSRFRWTLDTEDDLKVIKAIYDNLYKQDKIFYFQDILDFILKHPEISKINEHVKQKELGE